MLTLHTVENEKAQVCSGILWHKIHIKLHANRSVVQILKMETDKSAHVHTAAHMDSMMTS
jgi:hypothetical protein